MARRLNTTILLLKFTCFKEKKSTKQYQTIKKKMHFTCPYCSILNANPVKIQTIWGNTLRHSLS